MEFYSNNIAKTFEVRQKKSSKGNHGMKVKPIQGQQKLAFIGNRDQPEPRITRSKSQRYGDEYQILQQNDKEENDGRIEFFPSKA